MSLPYFFFRKKKRSDCKVRTLEAENFDEEDKSLVPAWLRTGGQRLPLHSSRLYVRPVESHNMHRLRPNGYPGCGSRREALRAHSLSSFPQPLGLKGRCHGHEAGKKKWVTEVTRNLSRLSISSSSCNLETLTMEQSSCRSNVPSSRSVSWRLPSLCVWLPGGFYVRPSADPPGRKQTHAGE